MKAEFEIVELSDSELEAIKGGLGQNGTDGSALSTANNPIDMRAVALGQNGTDGSALSTANNPVDMRAVALGLKGTDGHLITSN